MVIAGITGANWTIEVFDISGRCVISDSGISSEGSTFLNYNAESLPSGIYMLRVNVDGVEDVKSVSIVH